MNKHNNNQRGSIVVSILIISLFLSTVVTGLIVLSNSNLTRAKGRILFLQAQYAAESGADAAIANLNADPTSTYAGSGSEVELLENNQYRATFQSTVAAGADTNERVITSVGKVYQPASASTARYTYTIEATTNRTNGTAAVSGMVSRNIIEFASSVKDVTAIALYVNNYIWMNKNTTTLIAEKITVAGRNTTAANCSIGGTGNLEKPASFTIPGLTKTQITTAFNNCITPPGNNSNANFDVLANQGSVSRINSTYIPWNYYMDGTYSDSNTGCNDWTSGSSPRTIPSSGQPKETHYPDTGSNITASCGTSGNLQLNGVYNIEDHAHVRANFCATTACSPTFNNTSGSLKYIFVEGTVNFDSVTTSAGSSPLVIVSYAADPVSKASVCPLGGAIYVGNGNTNAPNLYLLAINGLCLDKSKFMANPAFGGFSGKNIYVASNSGSPHDPHLNTSFPYNEVPIDLAWHATRYRRIL